MINRKRDCIIIINLVFFSQSLHRMTENDVENELLDYEEDEVDAGGVGDTGLGHNDGGISIRKEGVKGSYVSIHSSGFRDFLLKPELLRAIVDCGFEHPSEGEQFEMC